MKELEKAKAKIKEILDEDAQITKVEFEGPEIAIYTENPKKFFENDTLVAKLAFELKKKINIRCDKKLLVDEEKARTIINELLPKDAGVQRIDFAPSFHEVVIEAIKPGLVIGKFGATTKEIVLKTGWTPKIWRAPTQKSKILEGIRYHLIKHSKERKEMLKETAEKIYSEIPEDENAWVRLVALGGFREVGRSCMLVETPYTKVMLDCGINIASTKHAYPYLEILQYPIDRIDALVISHAHLDHSGFVPYMFKMGFKGPVYCTEPTRDLMALLHFDYIDVLVKDGKEPIYNERDVKEMLKHVVVREYRTVTDIAPDVRITFHNASHILGSASIHLHLGEGYHNLVYSGDIKYGFTRLFNNMDTNYPRLETLIIESTYGAREDIQPERQKQEDRLIELINEVHSQNGTVLIPVFAVGRTQEIMLVLENAYAQGKLDPEMRCYIEGMTAEANAVHTAYPEYLRQTIKKRVLQNNSPFSSPMFEVANGGTREEVLEKGKGLILASSGMLTGGASLEYFKLMAEDSKNAIIFVGYQGKGSLGQKVSSGIKELPITVKSGKTKRLAINLKVERLEGFSGHSDRAQLMNYLKRIRPQPKKVLVDHGEQTKAVAFARAVSERLRINATAPSNLDAVRLK